MRPANHNRIQRVEVLESRFLFAGPAERFVLPIGGSPQVDWAITAYTDQDPQVGSAIDYRGRRYTFDGSTGVHFALPDFAKMDRGIDVFAAAGGTVVEVHNGEFDRNMSFADPPPPGTPDNYVLVDHGGGCRTRYGRLRNGSVVVGPGHVVTAGQKIAQVGGSGSPSPDGYMESGAYLRFEVTLDGTPVETFLDPQAWWRSPPPFAGDVPGVHDIFIGGYMPPAAESWDGISTKSVFHRGDQVYALTKWHGHNQGVFRRNRFYWPDGSEVPVGDNGNPSPEDRPQGLRFSTFRLGAAAPLGNWQASFEIDGREVTRTSFTVADPAQGLPEMKVYQGTTYVIDGRTTPLDFGSTHQGAGPVTRESVVSNYGTQPLTLDRVTLPEGFGMASALPLSIPAGGSGQLTIQLADQAVGSKAGRVIIHSNDASNAEFDFAIKGVVTGPPPTVVAVHFSSSIWQSSFYEALADGGDGSARYGCSVAAGDAQLKLLPWLNMTQISITFDEEVLVDPAALAVRGIRVPDYTLSEEGFVYESPEKVATWRLASDQPFENDQLTLELNSAGVRSLSGAPLDGDWMNPSEAPGGDAFPSGDGRVGGNFRFLVNISPGDVNRNGVVLADDASDVRNRFFRSSVNPGIGDAAYTVFHDVDGSGSILANDFSAVKQRFFNRLPPAQAIVPATTPLPFSHNRVIERLTSDEQASTQQNGRNRKSNDREVE